MSENEITPADIQMIRVTVAEVMCFAIERFGTDETRERFKDTPAIELLDHIDEPLVTMAIQTRCKMTLEVADKLERRLVVA